MKNLLLSLAAALIIAPVAFAAQKAVCTKTDKDVIGKCCYTVQTGKFLCSFTAKTYDQCCYQSK